MVTRHLLKQQQVRRKMYKDLVDKKGEYNTPLYLFDYLHKHFRFELDPCSTKDNHLELPIYYTKNGLEAEWNENTFVNPPYGAENERLWVNKFVQEIGKYNHNYFILLPSKTESQWFSRLFKLCNIIIFPQKRIQFIKDGKKKHGNTMGSVIFGSSSDEFACDEFRDENLNLNIPTHLTIDKYIFFPDRKVLEKNYLSTFTGHTK